MRITTNSISIYDKDGDYQRCLYNTKIKRMKFIDENFIYCIMGKMNGEIRISNVLTITEENSEHWADADARGGIWMVDVFQMVYKSRFEQYCFDIPLTAQGFAAKLNLGLYVNRLCYCNDFHTVSLMPFFHRNTYNFMGMGAKQDYLIWHNSEFYFIALTRKGFL